MPITKLRPSYAFTQERLEQLKQVVPEAFADGKVNWDVLRGAMGEELEDEGPGAEHFGLFWPGKREARRLAGIPSKGTLVPVPGEGIAEQNTRNIFIEGENLEVLKILQKSYAARVKMIYIDPPYNTGNDTVYRDNYVEPVEEYMRRVGSLSEQGHWLTSNTRSDGRFHSNWLSMMYPRLIVCKRVLRDDGLIFISIDDNEAHHLRMLMNDVFGEENFIGLFVWQSKKGGGSDKAGVVNDQEYVICYSKSVELGGVSRISLDAQPLDKSDEKGAYRLGRELNKWGSGSRREDRPTMYFPIPGPNGEDVFPVRNDGSEGRWRWGKEKMLAIAIRGDLEFVPRPDGTYIVYEKIRSEDPRLKPFRTWLTDVGTTADGSKIVRDLFDGKKVYDFPKPVQLIDRLVQIGAEGEDDIVLDFFAGSCTTAHALLEANRAAGGTRRFICVQMPEPTPPDSEAKKIGLRTIADIGKERIRRVAARMRTEGLQEAQNQGEDAQDVGFKALRLTTSNFKHWRAYPGGSAEELQGLFDQMESPLVDGWKESDLLAEVMLIQGFPLDSQLTQHSQLGSNRILLVSSDGCPFRLFVCFDKRIAEGSIGTLKLNPEDHFVCLDTALTDVTKALLADICNLDAI